MRNISFVGALALSLSALALAACAEAPAYEESAELDVQSKEPSLVEAVQSEIAYAEYEAGLTKPVTSENYDRLMGYTN